MQFWAFGHDFTSPYLNQSALLFDFYPPAWRQSMGVSEIKYICVRLFFHPNNRLAFLIFYEARVTRTLFHERCFG